MCYNPAQEEQEAPMAMPAIANYRDTSHHLLAQAHAELEAGDLRQASEKGWGAAAQMIKAVAEVRGRQHYSHRLLVGVVVDLIAENGDDDQLKALFASAQSLHVNFYENLFFRVLVEFHIDQVQQFVAKIESLIDE